MSQEVNVTVNFETEKAQESVKGLDKGVKDLGTSTKGAEGGFKSLTTGISATGVAFKAMGIGLIVAAFVKLKDMLMQNQVVMDTVTRATESIGFVFNQVIGTAVELGQKMAKAFSDPKQAVADLWTAIKQNISNRIEGLIDTFGALGKVIKSAFSRDLEGLKEGLAEAKTGFIQLNTGMTEVQQNTFVANLKEQTKQLKKNIKAADDFGAAVTRLRNEVKLAEATQRGLQLQYQKEAEVQRQIRDDISLTMEERIAANNELSSILDEQFIKEQELAHKKLALAELELSANQDNVDLQVAVINAKNELIDLDERITGQRSEQLTNLNALNKEYADSLKDVDKAENTTTKNAGTNTKTRVKWADMEKKEKLKLADQMMGALANVFGEESAAGKAMAIGQALINTYSAASAALAPPPLGAGPIVGPILAAGAIASGLANVKKITSTKLPYGDGGGGGAGGGGGGGGGGSAPSVPTPPSLEGIGGAAMIPDLEALETTGTGQGAIQAYVVENDISDAQALQEELDTQATL
tara:strand:+ start:8884 stop:10461 length:1578 start_codon:yes stop_codon:yes gene_type:complete